MFDVVRTVLGALLFAAMMLTPGGTEARPPHDGPVQTQERPVGLRQIAEETSTGARPFVRTELYFGTAVPDGAVTEAQFRKFVDEQVAQRFPDGLTVIKADGRFRDDDGGIVNEQSFVLVLLYPHEALAGSSRAIERIRTLYKEQFNQRSVLRVDAPFIAWVSF